MHLYVLYHCNQWHEYSSFRLIGVVDESACYQALKDIQEELDYTDEDMETYIHIDEMELNELDI